MDIKNDPFSIEDIEDVRILIKAKGKHYGISPKLEFGKEVGKQIRLLIGKQALDTHYIATPSLEEINKRKQK